MKSEAEKNLRFEKLYQRLLRDIEEGRFAAGEKIPAERDLAEQAGISYMTARQAVQALVDKGYLVRRPRIGTFVPDDIKKLFSVPTVNVIMPDCGGGVLGQFERAVTGLVLESALNCNLFKVTLENIDSAVRLLADTTRPCILLISDFVKEPGFCQAMLANPNVILVGYDLSGIGVKSVLCDDAMAVRMAYSVLQQAGHEKIALAISDVASPIFQQMIAGWRSSIACTGAPAGVGELAVLKGDIPKAVKKYLRKATGQSEMPFSAIITSNIEIGVAFHKTLGSVGLLVAGDVSVITLGFEEYLGDCRGKLTCVDPRLDKQVKYAVDCCQEIIKGKSPEMLHMVTPEIFAGDSVGQRSAE